MTVPIFLMPMPVSVRMPLFVPKNPCLFPNASVCFQNGLSKCVWHSFKKCRNILSLANRGCSTATRFVILYILIIYEQNEKRNSHYVANYLIYKSVGKYFHYIQTSNQSTSATSRFDNKMFLVPSALYEMFSL